MSKKIFYENIEKKTLLNKDYRKVAWTGKKQQFVYMNIKPGDDIHMEVHQHIDQFFRIESGKGKAIVDGKNYKLEDGIGLIVPAGSSHRIMNTSKTDDLKLYSL